MRDCNRIEGISCQTIAVENELPALKDFFKDFLYEKLVFLGHKISFPNFEKKETISGDLKSNISEENN